MRDLGVTAAVAPQVPEPIVPLLIVLTALGGPKLVAVGSIAGSLHGTWSGRINSLRVRRFLVAIALTLSVSILLKHGLGMPRPPSSLMAIPEDGFGFPSGHATAAAGLATALVGVFGRGEGWLRVLAVAYVSLVAATRILLGVHFLPDVLAGVGVGVVVAWVALRADHRRPRLTLASAVVAVLAALPVWAVS